MADKELKLYYVQGKDWQGNRRVVKTYAHTVADARDNALWTLKTAGKVTRG